jgi:hypothetical protein
MTILSQAEAIRDETTARANTAERVGDCLVDIAEAIENKAFGSLYMNGNAVVTDCDNTSSFFKILGTTAANAENNQFTHSNNRLTYTGTGTIKAVVHGQVTVFCDHGSHVVELGIYKTSAVDTNYVGRVMIQAGANKATQLCVLGYVELATNDFIELHLKAVESAEEYTVSNLVIMINQD